MRNPELARLRQLVAQQGQGWRLHQGSGAGFYDLHDRAGLLEAENVTAQEIRQLCAGQIGLGQLRQPSR